MVRSLFFLTLSLCLGLPAAAQAPLDWGLCRQFGKGASKEKLSACTALIESKRYAGNDLANIHVMRGRIHFSSGEIDRALVEYNEALRIDPRNCEALYSRSLVSATKNNSDDTIADLSQAISFCPTVGEYYRQRGISRLAKHELDEAISDLDVALRLNPDDAIALMIRGMAKQSKGDAKGSQSDKKRWKKH